MDIYFLFDQVLVSFLAEVNITAAMFYIRVLINVFLLFYSCLFTLDMHIYKLTKTVSDSRFSIVACTVELFDLKYSGEMCMAVLMNCRKTLPHDVVAFFFFYN